VGKGFDGDRGPLSHLDIRAGPAPAQHLLRPGMGRLARGGGGRESPPEDFFFSKPLICSDLPKILLLAGGRDPPLPPNPSHPCLQQVETATAPPADVVVTTPIPHLVVMRALLT